MLLHKVLTFYRNFCSYVCFNWWETDENYWKIITSHSITSLQCCFSSPVQNFQIDFWIQYRLSRGQWTCWWSVQLNLTASTSFLCSRVETFCTLTDDGVSWVLTGRASAKNPERSSAFIDYHLGLRPCSFSPAGQQPNSFQPHTRRGGISSLVSLIVKNGGTV